MQLHHQLKITFYQALVLLMVIIASGVSLGVESSANLAARNHISGLRLQQQLKLEQASSIFNEAGYLTPEAISKADLIVAGERLRNPKLIEELSSKGGNLADWGKYETQSVTSPSGPYKAHFYYNPVTNEVHYGMDYKAIFNHQGRWDLGLKPNFDYEPPRFDKP